MKQGAWIGFVVALLMAACSSSPSASVRYASPDPTLAAIDSLLWTQPDSAFSQLQAFAESHEVDSLNAFNGHYFHLLLSELLYKNDCEQSNRNELLRAVDYYDSLVAEGGSRVDADMVFLDARAHYIDGVGYYEMDSVIPACREYLRAVELMEEHFGEEELMGKKAHFMALAYTHLAALFSDQYLHEQAIYFGQQSLSYYKRYEATPWHVSWTLNHIGLHFDMIDQRDSADYYYQDALKALPDTNCLIYRDINSALAYLSYRLGNSPSLSLKQLHNLLSHAENSKERFSRYLTIGEIYYQEKQWDSANYYLKTVFDSTSSVDVKVFSAQHLSEIFKDESDTLSFNVYDKYLAQQANDGTNKAMLHSSLVKLCRDHDLKMLENQHRKRIEKQRSWVMPILAFVVLSLGLLAVLWGRSHSKRGFLREPICKEIQLLVSQNSFKAKIDHRIYKSCALSQGQLMELRDAADRHFNQITSRLQNKYTALNNDDINHCCLCLLGLEEAAISALTQKSYTAVCDRNRKLKRIFGTNSELSVYLRNI
jgi:tetratricopeptide (TPR) repeat protein